MLARCAAALAAVVALVAAVPAASTPVRWDLSGVTFDDGATAEGAFLFDPEQGSDGSLFLAGDAFIITGRTPGWTTTSGQFLIYSDTGLTTPTLSQTTTTLGPTSFELAYWVDGEALGTLRLVFEAVLENEFPASLALSPESYEIRRIFDEASGEFVTIRHSVTGGIAMNAVIPEPGAFAVFATGLGVVGSHLRRRHRGRHGGGSEPRQRFDPPGDRR